MNEESRQFIEDVTFDQLYKELNEKCKPLKPQWDRQNLQEIGRLIVQFQRMERSIKSFIGILLNLADNKNIVDILTTKSSFGNLLSMLLNIAEEKKFYRSKELKLIVNRAGIAEKIRNQIVHSEWTSGPRIKTTVDNKGVQHKFEIYDVGDLAKLADQIDRIDTAIIALQVDYIDWCHKKGDTPRGVTYYE